jgi:hypothetical protein
MALARGRSQLRIGKHLTDHSRAASYVLQNFIPELKIDVRIEQEEGLEYSVISIDGIGYWCR